MARFHQIQDSSSVSASNPYGWVAIAEPGFTKVILPWGSVDFVNDFNAQAINAEIAKQAALPSAQRDYAYLNQLLVADYQTNPDTTSSAPANQIDPRLARAIALGYGSSPTPQQLVAADQGITFDQWQAQQTPADPNQQPPQGSQTAPPISGGAQSNTGNVSQTGGSTAGTAPPILDYASPAGGTGGAGGETIIEKGFDSLTRALLFVLIGAVAVFWLTR